MCSITFSPLVQAYLPFLSEARHFLSHFLNVAYQLTIRAEEYVSMFGV